MNEILNPSLPSICILAGGLGTRLGEQVANTPKPLLPVAGKPFLEHQLLLLKRYGAKKITICVGYLGELIEETIGDGKQWDLEITYSYDGGSLLGTAGAIRKAIHLLDDDFLVLYGDTYLKIDYRDVTNKYYESELPALMTVLKNNGQWDTSNVSYSDGVVTLYDKHNPSPTMEWIDYGLGVLNKSVFTSTNSSYTDLADIYHDLSKENLLAGYVATERFYEIGTPQALLETEKVLASITTNS